MRKSAFYILLLIFIPKISFSQKELFSPKYSTVLKVNNNSKFLRQCTRKTPSEIDSYFILTKEDAQKMEKNLIKVYDLDAGKVSCGDNKIKNLSSFGYQYLGIILKGKKYIYVNAFYLTNSKDANLNFLKSNWKKKLVNVCDGGGGFWGVIYNIEEGKFTDLEFNSCG